MKDYGMLRQGVKRVAWRYFFLYFDLNIGTASLTPAFVGYLLMLSAIRLLKDEVRDLGLLSTMGRILAVWHGAQWAAGLIGGSFDGLWQFVDILIGIVNIYFHFQLLTGLAVIAGRYQPEGDHQDMKLLRYRTVQTVVLTAIEVILYLCPRTSELWSAVSVVLALVYLVVGVCLVVALFRLRKCFPVTEGA